jgi:HEAT repeat protein
MRSRPLAVASCLAVLAIAVAGTAIGRRADSDVPRRRVPRTAAERPADPPEETEPSFGRPSDPAERRETGGERVRALLRGRRREDRALALRSLESLPDRAEKMALLGEALEGADDRTKSRVLSILRSLGGSDSAALALEIFRAEGPPWLRAYAASVLGELGDPAALPDLLDASRGGDLQIRTGAAAALDRLGQPAPLWEVIASLALMLDHPDGAKREDAVDLLSGLRTPEAIAPLAKALADPTNSRVRAAAADALGQTRLAAAIPSLEAALGDPEPSVRRAAARALETLGSAVRSP